MGPVGLGQRVGVGEGVKKKMQTFFSYLKKKKCDGGALMVARALRDEAGGVEGRKKGLKNYKSIKESVKEKRLAKCAQ